jgi:hypothetical protein
MFAGVQLSPVSKVLKFIVQRHYFSPKAIQEKSLSGPGRFHDHLP